MEPIFPERVACPDFQSSFKIMLHERTDLCAQAKLACALAERWGIVAAIEDGEDSAGRQKLRHMTPEELAQRACQCAANLFQRFSEIGWIATHDAAADVTKKVEAEAAERRRQGAEELARAREERKKVE